MKIYGLSGKKQSGKNTFSDFALSMLELSQCRSMSFAAPLKRFCIEYLGLTNYGCDGSDVQKNAVCGTWSMFNASIRNMFAKSEHDDISNREVMQVVGTEVFRKCFRETFWVDLMRTRLATVRDEGCKVVFITDVRFPNEMSMIREFGGKIIRITRETIDNKHIQHDSELLMSQISNSAFDYVVNNDGSIDDYREKVSTILYKEGLLP